MKLNERIEEALEEIELGIYVDAKYAPTLMQLIKDMQAELEKTFNDMRTVIIEEICEQYYQPIIDNFYEARKSPDVGHYAHENDIKLYQKLQRELRKKEWLTPPNEDK